ncbi:hypothetical protein B0H14DRAFT_3092176 [Mycena olivaceomarginata]|nr:hypothetical protein B0H14DRAFT_3092176 [Mycena olivaceomarginata]
MGWEHSECQCEPDTAERGTRFPQPRCHPETRTKMLSVLEYWIKDLSQNDRRDICILWLNGPAGAGKSALEAKGCLGASFFFKCGNASRGNGNKLFPTIAYQLALHLPQLRGAITQVVEKDPSIVDRSLSIQMEQLIIKPCQMHLSGRCEPVPVIIDGLDEGTGPEVRQEILRSIGESLRDQGLNLRFLIASRPEAHIQEMFSDSLSKIHLGFPID